ncbi:MAG: class I SAM-dependent methyltransferase [Nitrososphaera sp.]|nr:class I SAM-dependent methyltransferase [Nitrososphaera sp.]
MTGNNKNRNHQQKDPGATYVSDAADLYDNIVDWYVTSFWNDQTDQDWVDECVKSIPPGSTVADVGSGPGNYAQYFAKSGHTVYCIDISERMVQEAEKRLPGITGRVGDMRKLPLENDSVDCLFCAYSINHILGSDVNKVISEFARVTKDHGLIQIFFKEGKKQYEFTARNVPESRAIMNLYEAPYLADLFETHRIKVLSTKLKDDASQNEFAHRKAFIKGMKAYTYTQAD